MTHLRPWQSCPSYLFSHKSYQRLVHSFIHPSFHSFIDIMVDWLIDWLVDWLIYGLNDIMVNKWLIDRLMVFDWFSTWIGKNKLFFGVNKRIFGSKKYDMGWKACFFLLLQLFIFFQIFKIMGGGFLKIYTPACLSNLFILNDW